MLRNFVLFTIMIAVGCTSATEKKATSDSTGLAPVPFNDTSVAGCYMQVLKKDTFIANLQQQKNLVNGTMSFNNYEKDKSTGTVSGKMDGDILKLSYTFASEGTTSVMELYFKYTNGNLVRGIGEMNTKGDTAYFVDPAQITYREDEFKKIPCQDLPAKYK